MSNASILDFFKEDFSLFIEAGFIAIKQANEIAARRLFKAAETINPECSMSELGYGYIALNKLLVAESASIFEKILKKEPENHLARALLGISLLLTKDKKKEGEELVQRAKQESDDPTIHHLANVAFEWLKKDLLKPKLFHVQSPLGEVNS